MLDCSFPVLRWARAAFDAALAEASETSRSKRSQPPASLAHFIEARRRLKAVDPFPFGLNHGSKLAVVDLGGRASLDHVSTPDATAAALLAAVGHTAG